MSHAAECGVPEPGVEIPRRGIRVIELHPADHAEYPGMGAGNVEQELRIDTGVFGLHEHGTRHASAFEFAGSLLR